MERVGHECIKAFAGSGKTYTLVIRYIRLLALGVDPSRINALTFTRKASGEFLQRIFLRLMQAAADQKKASELAQQIDRQDMQPRDFRILLMKMISDIGQLQLGTIDSFFARLVGAFPYELGLSRVHKILDDYEHELARQISMEELLKAGDDERDGQLLQLYKGLTWGSQDKNVYRLFQDKFKNYQSLYQEVNDKSAWGNSSRIFIDQPWWLTSSDDIKKFVNEANTSLLKHDYGTRLENALLKLLNDFQNWSPGTAIEGKIFEQLMEQHSELDSGIAVITYYGKDYELENELGQCFLSLIKIYLSKEIARRVLLTQSLGELLEEFDRIYDHRIRETGSLVFSDFPILLMKGLVDENPIFNQDDILYRLDSLADHWLLDEFQDTSRIQWKVLSLFIDEILQDPEQRRSLFYVGDIKQSIYSWRGGDPKLFNEILDKYNSVIQTKPLKQSWRSSPHVLELVNQVFGKGINPTLMGQEVAERWHSGDNWLDHKPSSKTSGLTGYSAWGVVDDKTAIAGACVDLIKHVNPMDKQLSCAVLVRKNKEVVQITQELRSAGIPASMEGVDLITQDNFLGRWIIAFLNAMIHPENPFYEDWLNMTGYGFSKNEARKMFGLIRWIITTDGYPEAISRLIDFIGNKIEFTEFLLLRCQQIIEAVTRFESLPNKSLEKFIQYLDGYSVAEISLTDQIQVMTVHKAKGLDFDIAIVAGFGAESIIGGSRDSLHVCRNPDGDVDWILEMPNKSIYKNIEELNSENQRYEDDQLYESLCVLYVAMTRARRGLYCISEKPSRNSSSTTWHDLFSTLDVRDDISSEVGDIQWQYEYGQDNWFNTVDGDTELDLNILTLDKILDLPPQKPFRQRISSPSTEAHQGDDPIPVMVSSSGRRFGTIVHDFLATVQWVNKNNIDEILAGADKEIRTCIQSLFQSDLGKEVFTKPLTPCSLWREKPYVYRKENKTAHGIVDRAIIYLDTDDEAQSMVIYDFKTDKLDPERDTNKQLMEKYHIQLERYREAAAALTGLPEDKIRAVLVPV